MLQKADSYYYSPPHPQDNTFLSLLLIAFLIAALIALIVFLVSWVSGDKKGKKKDEKTAKEEVEKIFKELKDNAIQFKREELVPSLQAAKDKIIGVLDKKGISDKV